MVSGLNADPSSYTPCVTVFICPVFAVTALGLKVGSEVMAITSPVSLSSTMPPAPRAWNTAIALASSLSSAACTRRSRLSATGRPRSAGSTSRAFRNFSMPRTPRPSMSR